MTVGTTWIAYKKNMEQLAKFVQLTYIIVAYSAKPTKGKQYLPMWLFMNVLGDNGGVELQP